MSMSTGWNTFQMLIIDRTDRAAGHFDIEFNYQHILWETGDAMAARSVSAGPRARVVFRMARVLRVHSMNSQGSRHAGLFA